MTYRTRSIIGLLVVFGAAGAAWKATEDALVGTFVFFLALLVESFITRATS